MVAFNEASTRRVLSPWGAEVKKRLIDRSLKQDDLVSMLRHQGYSVDKAALSNLLYGIGVSNSFELRPTEELEAQSHRSITPICLR